MSDVEIVARVERRRKWAIEEKAALIAEVETEGGKVKLVARRHGISGKRPVSLVAVRHLTWTSRLRGRRRADSI